MPGGMFVCVCVTFLLPPTIKRLTCFHKLSFEEIFVSLLFRAVKLVNCKLFQPNSLSKSEDNLYSKILKEF